MRAKIIHALLVILFLASPRASALEIVIMVDKDSYDGFLDGLNTWKKKISDTVLANVQGEKKLGAFEVAYIKGHRLLSRAELVNDVDKHDADEGVKWHELTLEAGVAVPFMLPLSGLLGAVDIGIEANGKVSASKRYQITMPDVLSLASDEEVKGTVDLASHINKIYKLISLPFDAEKLQDSLPTGAEIKSFGERSLLVKIGPRVGVTGIALKAKTHLLIESLFSTSLKLLATVSGNTFVKYRVESKKQNDFGIEAKLTTGLTFLNTSFLDNVVGSEIITATLQREKQSDLVYEFIYDLNYQEARKALTRALVGDISMSQDIGMFRTSSDAYQGVSIMEKRTDLLVDIVKSGKVALTAGEKHILPKVQKLLGQEFSGSLVEFSRNVVEGDSVSTSVNMIEEREEVASYKFNYDKTNELLLGFLVDNVSKIDINSTALLAGVVSAAQGIKHTTVNHLQFDYLYHEQKNANAVIESFFNVAGNVLGANQPALRKIVHGLRSSNSCNLGKEAKFRIKGVLSNKAIENLLTYQPAEVWTGVAKIANFTPASYFRYPSKRAELIAKLNRKTRKLLGRFEENVIPFWSQKLTDKKVIAEKLRDLFVELKGDPFLLELLVFLSSADYRQDKDPDRFSQGVAVSVSLETQGCQLQWSQAGRGLFNVNT